MRFATVLSCLCLFIGLHGSATAGIFAPFHEVRAYVTGYNTVPGQTDDTPCVAASGANICGRSDAVACPRHIRLGTWVKIRDIYYVCEDRLAKKFPTRFDISCDDDTKCPPQVTGWVVVRILGAERQVNVASAAPMLRASSPAPAKVTRSVAMLRGRGRGPRAA